MTIPGNSRTSASSERRGRRLALVGLLLYALVALADMTAHLRADAHAGRRWHDPGNIAVAFAAGLFWPADFVAAALLSD